MNFVNFVKEALIFSRIMYYLPYAKITSTQRKKIDIIIRKCARLALGVPKFAPNHEIEATGLFNSLEDRIDMHNQAQIQT